MGCARASGGRPGGGGGLELELAVCDVSATVVVVCLQGGGSGGGGELSKSPRLVPSACVGEACAGGGACCADPAAFFAGGAFMGGSDVEPFACVGWAIDAGRAFCADTADFAVPDCGLFVKFGTGTCVPTRGSVCLVFTNDFAFRKKPSHKHSKTLAMPRPTLASGTSMGSKAQVCPSCQTILTTPATTDSISGCR